MKDGVPSFRPGLKAVKEAEIWLPRSFPDGAAG